MSAPLLEIRGLTKSFGALRVTDNVCLDVKPGELHAVIGPNGAGKSCLIGQISGEMPNDAGSISFGGNNVDGVPVHQRARRGLVRAYQVPQLFSSFSAHDNAVVSAIARTRTHRRWWRPVRDEDDVARSASVALDKLNIGHLSDRQAAVLGHGEKRELELAMGLAAEPRLLLLDEPLAGLGPGESQRMIDFLRTLKKTYAMLLVEHDMQAVFSLADRVSVLVAGRIIACGTPEEIRENADVRAAYLGEE